MKKFKKFLLLVLILFSVGYIFMISYKINVFLSSEPKINEEIFLELSKKGMSKEVINKLPYNLANYIAKDKTLVKLTRSYNTKYISLVFSTTEISTENIRDNNVSLNYFIRNNIKFNPFDKDTILLVTDFNKSHESNNFLFVEGIDYLGRTKVYNKISMNHFSYEKYEKGEVFVVPNLMIYKRFIICNSPYEEILGYLSK